MVRKGLYRHFKGNLYRVTHVAQHCEDESWWVTYQALYGNKGYWIRALDDFDQMIERNGKKQRRFEYCEQQSLLTEQIGIDVLPGSSHNFEQQFEQHQHLISDAQQYVEHSLQRDHHRSDRYQLSIIWLPDQHQGKQFALTTAYQQFSEKLETYFAKQAVIHQFSRPISKL